MGMRADEQARRWRHATPPMSTHSISNGVGIVYYLHVASSVAHSGAWRGVGGGSGWSVGRDEDDGRGFIATNWGRREPAVIDGSACSDGGPSAILDVVGVGSGSADQAQAGDAGVPLGAASALPLSGDVDDGEGGVGAGCCCGEATSGAVASFSRTHSARLNSSCSIRPFAPGKSSAAAFHSGITTKSRKPSCSLAMSCGVLKFLWCGAIGKPSSASRFACAASARQQQQQ